MPGRPTLLVLFLTASLAAFGGIYEWALLPILAAALGLALLSESFTSAPADTRTLDLALVVLLLAMALQLMPLPPSLRSALSPQLAVTEAAVRLDAAIQPARFAPLTLDPRGTLHALMLAVAVVLTYRAARAIFSTGGVRTVCRAMSVVGALFAVAAMVQRALSPMLIYGFWAPLDLGAQPFGPVVNRNHFAGWLVMTGTLTAGYFAMRVSRRMQTTRRWRRSRRLLLAVAQSTVVWTALSWLVITATVIVAQSRSALVALAVSLITLLRSVTSSAAPVVVAVGVAVVAASVLLVAGETATTRLADRFASTVDSRDVSRTMIWRDTTGIIADFPLTGVGAGAFGRAMLASQRTHAFAPHFNTEWYFNHAHNHYLQLAAEGGGLLVLPAIAVVVSFAGVVRRRLRNDTSEYRAVRLGAVAGLVGIATQSLWEVPLTMPAAALLAATLAAVATYQRTH